MAEPVKIAIVLQCGMVQAVLSAGVPVEYVLIDYDTDGADRADVFEVPQPGSAYGPADAVGHIAKAEIAGPRVLELFGLPALDHR